MNSQNPPPVRRGALVVMLGIVASRFLGIVREIVFARIFGANKYTDAYFQAFRIPDLFYFLMAGGALAAGFIPAFSERLARGQKDAAWHLFRSLLTLLLLSSSLIIGTAFAFSPILTLLVGKGFDRETTALCASLMRIILPAQIFFVVGGLFMGALNSLRAFFWSAQAPTLYNLFIIGAILLLGPHYGLYGVAWGVLAGAFAAQILLQGPPLKLMGASFRLLWDPFHPGVKQVARLILPVTLGLCLFQINIIVGSVIAAGLGPSSVSSLNYAFRIVWLPISVFGQSLGISLFPALSAHASLDELDQFRRKLALSLRLLFFVTLLPTSLLMLLPAQTIRLLLQSGRFTSSNTAQAGIALLFLSPTAVFTSLQQVTVRAFYALQRPIIPVSVGALSLLFCIVASLWLAVPMKLPGVALANSLAAIVNCSILIWLLGRRLQGLESRAGAHSALKSVLSLIPSILVTVASSRWCHSHLPTDSKVFQGLQLLLPSGLATAAYFVTASLLRHPELSYCFNLLRRRKAHVP